MGLQAVYLRNRQGVISNSTQQHVSSVPVATRWSAARSASVYGQANGQLNPFCLEYPRREENDNAGNFEALHDKKSSQVAISFKSSLPNSARFDPCLGKKMHPYGVDESYGVFSAFGPLLSGRILLPFSSATNNGPVYVNAKQYHGILRRRLTRANAMKGKSTRARKPYMHESRHLHAMRRPRGCGGRFLNTKKAAKADSSSTRSESPTSQISEVLQADYKEGFNHLGSEATDTRSKEIAGGFQINRHTMDLDRGLFLPGKWGFI